ncbi:MAG: metallophosphoesterase family protein [Thermoproteota archaeon]
MYKFAHISDCHIGANREPALESLELTAFSKALDTCIREKVDFILITGDLFHANIPDIRVANEAVRKMKEVRDEGIPIYVIYGSHDYSPNQTSMVDVLDSAGLIKKIVKGKVIEGKLKLEFFEDPKTKAKLTGISARKVGLEKNYFEILDRETLEKEKGFKIFAFHSALSELKPEFLAEMEAIPLSFLPKGFNYYAGGHIHQYCEASFPGYERIAYPGTLFAGYPRDFEQSAKGVKRGFIIVHFGDKVEEVKFHEVSVCNYTYFEYDVTNKNSIQARTDLLEKLNKIDVHGKLVMVKIKGELSGGKTSDISASEIRTMLIERGAIHVILNRYALTSKEYVAVKVMGEDIQTIENKLLRENIGIVKVSNEELKGEKGTKLASDLLRILRQEQKLSESKKDYMERIQKMAVEILGLEEVFK